MQLDELVFVLLKVVMNSQNKVNIVIFTTLMHIHVSYAN